MVSSKSQGLIEVPRSSINGSRNIVTYDSVSHFQWQAPKATLGQRTHDFWRNTGNSYILTIFYVPGSLSTLPHLNLKTSLQNKHYLHFYKGWDRWFAQCHLLVNSRAGNWCPVLLALSSTLCSRRRPSEGDWLSFWYLHSDLWVKKKSVLLPILYI